MNGIVSDHSARAKPLFWYGLPHGFQELGPAVSGARIQEVQNELNGRDDEFGERSRQLLRFYLGVTEALRGRGVNSAALGMHPDESGGVSLSVLTASSLQSASVNPKAVLVNMLESAPEGAGVRPLELPVGPAFFMESVQQRRAPGYPADEEGPHTQEKVWEGSVVIPDTRNSSVLTLQLSTPTVSSAQDYAQILIAIAHTVSFTGPEVAEGGGSESAPEPSSIAQDIMDDFG